VKERLRELLHGTAGGPAARNLAREFLQASILAALQRAGAMVPLAFQGGTALRFLYSIRRYSEDLDFALERAEAGYDFRAYLEAVRADMRRDGYDVDLARVSDQRAVHSGFVRFPGLLHELGLSGHREEALSVKLEVDARPPSGAALETTVVRRHVLLRIQHHDRASLLAGKLHAILQRPYPKGRDFYDLIWYLSDRAWPPPNLILLNNALAQTGWTLAPLSETSWVAAVRARLGSVRWEALAADVRPLLESAEDRALLTRETITSLLDQRTRPLPTFPLPPKGRGRKGRN
jgi:Nucleotidyl transferase AbiEii toxin, Type IV TA system